MIVYVASPRTEDPAELLADRDIAIRYLRRELEQAEATIQDRERWIGELLRELAGTESPAVPTTNSGTTGTTGTTGTA